jgi:hypothetical protein
MNERIQELAAQSGLPKYITREIGPTVIQKFAELIVQECIDICLRNHTNNIETISAGECAYDIQEHFGVE